MSIPEARMQHGGVSSQSAFVMGRRRRRTTTWAMRGILLGAVMLPSTVVGQEAESQWTRAARAWLELLRTGAYAEASAQAAPGEAAAAFTPERLRTIWTQVTAQAGGLDSLTALRELTADSLHVVELTGHFSLAQLTVRVALTPAERIAGLFFLPPSAPAPLDRVPEYVDRAAFTEEPVTIGSSRWQVEGTLSLPSSGDDLPAVVLVHGSGPQDRDETIGPNRPFRDLAWGLASRGVAVLRYEKRTKTHGARMGADVTVDEEVVEDAVAAIDVARSHARIDDDRVVLAGHSLGAMLAPEIAARSGKAAGVIMLAAPARDLADVMVEQLAYVRGTVPEGQRAALDTALAAARRLAAHEASPEETVLGAPASYFYDLEARDHVAAARSLDVPLLVVQGGRDYQVTMEDFGLWQEALGGRENARLEAYPDLNHLFMTGQGMATPAEYARPGFVDARIVELIAAFARAR
jgi:uncharacterized protein